MTNKPFTENQVKKLKIGFHPSGSFPNRKHRRLIKQKRTHRPNMSMVSFIQWIGNKRIFHYKKTIDYN
jgi:hypothetical protein